jgi:magnesium-transporting ATPase (P-type)
VILGVAALVFAFGVLGRGYDAIHMFMVVVSLSVAAIPEGLPAILTVTLAIGVQRMAARHAIIRRLPAVETLGSVSVICSDKTGTLTRNEMTVRAIMTADGTIEVTGTGYAPVGGFYRDGAPVQTDAEPSIVTIARAGLLCNEASLREQDGEWVVDGDPVDGVLLALAHKAGLDPATELAALPRTDLIPFDSQHRYMASLHHDHEGNGVIFVKGAPERILEMSEREWSSAGERPLDRTRWEARSRRRDCGYSPSRTRGPWPSTVR